MKGRIITNFVNYVMPQYNFGSIEAQPIVKNTEIEIWQLIYTDDIGIKSKHDMCIVWNRNNSNGLYIEKLLWHPHDNEHRTLFYHWQYKQARRRYRSLRKYSEIKHIRNAYKLLQELKEIR